MSESELPNELSPAQKEAIKKRRALSRSYAAVFGLPGSRNAHQNAVWADLAAIGFDKVPLLMNTQDGMGSIDPLRLAANDGKRTVFLHIQRHLEESASSPEMPEEPKKPKVRK